MLTAVAGWGDPLPDLVQVGDLPNMGHGSWHDPTRWVGGVEMD